MARIAGVTLPDNKVIPIALTAIFGVGRTKSAGLLAKAKIDPRKRAKELTDAELDRLRVLVDAMKVEGDLRLVVSQHVRRLKDIASYRGLRHMKGLPVRGQRTKTNARTRKGKKKTVGSGRKDANAKT
jgi:small subunit ribosomal protein S13